MNVVVKFMKASIQTFDMKSSLINSSSIQHFLCEAIDLAVRIFDTK